MSLSRLLARTEAPRSPQWRAVRRAHLKREPECQACGTRRLLQVHHIKPFHEFPELELVDSNLITLCEGLIRGRHHLEFGHRGDWKTSNPHVAADAESFYVTTHQQ